MTENIFTEIFKIKHWGKHEESVSGAGSSLDYTNELRNDLVIFFNNFKIKKLFDAPCGDFNWMKEVLKIAPLEYEGGDIVEELIDNNKKIYESINVKFKNFDITSYNFPEADVWLCRDCFIHLSYQDILSSLKKFCESDIKYILTTTHTNSGQFENKDIVSGGFRYIDLFSFPFNLPKDTLYKIKDWKPPYAPAELVLFTKEQIKDSLINLENNIKK